jgi:hypothetical protein
MVQRKKLERMTRKYTKICTPNCHKNTKWPKMTKNAVPGLSKIDQNWDFWYANITFGSPAIKPLLYMHHGEIHVWHS